MDQDSTADRRQVARLAHDIGAGTAQVSVYETLQGGAGVHRAQEYLPNHFDRSPYIDGLAGQCRARATWFEHDRQSRPAH